MLAHCHNTYNSNGRVKACHVHATGRLTVVALICRSHFFRVVKVTDRLGRVGVQVNQHITCSSLITRF